MLPIYLLRIAGVALIICTVPVCEDGNKSMPASPLTCDNCNFVSRNTPLRSNIQWLVVTIQVHDGTDDRAECSYVQLASFLECLIVVARTPAVRATPPHGLWVVFFLIMCGVEPNPGPPIRAGGVLPTEVARRVIEAATYNEKLSNLKAKPGADCSVSRSWRSNSDCALRKQKSRALKVIEFWTQTGVIDQGSAYYLRRHHPDTLQFLQENFGITFKLEVQRQAPLINLSGSCTPRREEAPDPCAPRQEGQEPAAPRTPRREEAPDPCAPRQEGQEPAAPCTPRREEAPDPCAPQQEVQEPAAPRTPRREEAPDPCAPRQEGQEPAAPCTPRQEGQEEKHSETKLSGVDFLRSWFIRTNTPLAKIEDFLQSMHAHKVVLDHKELPRSQRTLMKVSKDMSDVPIVEMSGQVPKNSSKAAIEHFALTSGGNFIYYGVRNCLRALSPGMVKREAHIRLLRKVNAANGRTLSKGLFHLAYASELHYETVRKRHGRSTKPVDNHAVFRCNTSVIALKVHVDQVNPFKNSVQASTLPLLASIHRIAAFDIVKREIIPDTGMLHNAV